MTPLFKKNISLILFLISGFFSISQAQDNLSYNIAFETAKSELPQSVIDTLVTRLHTWQDYKIILEGHTDNVGTEAYNQKLSQARVNEIKSILVRHKIETDRIIILASGATKPIADNKTEEGRAENRRVEILLTTHILDKALVLEKTKQLNDKLLTLISKRGVTHRINPRVEQKIVAKQGTRIRVPANAFDVPEGADVLLKVTEIYRKSDMILHNLATVSNGHALETGGMLKIEAFSNGLPVQLKEGIALDVEVPTRQIEDSMQLFSSVVADNGSINWVQPQPLARSTRYIAPPNLNWNINNDSSALFPDPKEPLNPSLKKEPGPVDSSSYYQLKARAKELRETPYKSYLNYTVVKGLFGKRKVKKSKKDSINYLVTVQKMIKSVESKIRGQERRMQKHVQLIENHNAYLGLLQKHKKWEQTRDSIHLENLRIVTKRRDINKMQKYSMVLKGIAYHEYWANFYGPSGNINNLREYNTIGFVGEEGDSLLCLTAIKNQDTLVVNMIRRQYYKEKLMLGIYQTETVEDAYIAHSKYRKYAKYKFLADKLNITIEEVIKREKIKKKWAENSQYLFQMADLGQYINCDFFPGMAPEELLVTATLDLPISIGVTKTMMVFKNYNTVMTADVGTYTNSNQCSWRNIPLEEPVKIVSIYIDENEQMQVAIQELNVKRELSTLEYKPMTEQDFLRALSKVNDIAMK
jgi:hypothetical protein